jgi:hypothetical protein
VLELELATGLELATDVKFQWHPDVMDLNYEDAIHN